MLSRATRGLSGALGGSAAAAAPPAAADGGDDFCDAEEAALHEDAHEDGGLGCTDLALLERQRGAIVAVAKSLGRKLLAGQFDLLSVSLPAALFEPRSYLQKLCDPWVFPRLLDRAAAASDDPVERMRWAVAFFVAGLHRVFSRWAKPFNPILGETFAARQASGGAIFLEQVSHHPPVSAFELHGARGAWRFHGASEPAVAYVANGVKTSARGRRRMEFADGGAIDMASVGFAIKGLLYTAAPRGEVVGIAEFLDAGAGVAAEVRFGRVEGARAGSALARPDALRATVFRAPPPASPRAAGRAAAAARAAAAGSLLSKSFRSLRAAATAAGAAEPAAPREVLAEGRGNWLSHLDWGAERYWTLAEEEEEPWVAVPPAEALPSDARFREDLAALAAGDVAGAQAAKERMEAAQREDARLRKAGSGG